MHGPSAATVLEFAMKLGHTCVVYSYDSVWCNVINDKTDDLLNYHEPPVQIWKGGNNENGSDCQNSNDIITAVRNGNLLAHKLIICIDPKDMDVLKEKVMNDPTLAPLLSKDSALESGIDFCYPLPKFLEFGKKIRN